MHNEPDEAPSASSKETGNTLTNRTWAKQGARSGLVQDDRGDYVHLGKDKSPKVERGETPKRGSRPTIHESEAFKNKVTFNVKPRVKDKGKRKAKGD